MLKPSRHPFDKSLCNGLAAYRSTYAPAHRLARLFTKYYFSVCVYVYVYGRLHLVLTTKLLRHVCRTFQHIYWRNNNNNNNSYNKKSENTWVQWANRNNNNDNYIRRKLTKEKLYLCTHIGEQWKLILTTVLNCFYWPFYLSLAARHVIFVLGKVKYLLTF